MTAGLLHLDDFLRGSGRFAEHQSAARPWWWVPLIVLVCSPIYGAVMGSYSVDSFERLPLSLYAAAKAPMLLLVTSLLCLPAFFVLNTVAGLRDDFREVLQAILTGQAALSAALASIAPITCVWYLSDASYRAALLFNGAAFAVASLAGQLAMLREYRRLIRRRPRHRLMLIGWLVLYIFVGIQMGWMLRPFVGSPDLPARFFRPEPFSNAYVVVGRLVVDR